MRVSGKEISEISKELALSETIIRTMLNDAWTKASAQISKYAELLVAFDVQRLETLIDKMMVMALEQDSLHAIDRVIKLINLKSKLIQKESGRNVPVNISGNIHHTHEQVFTVNSEEYAMAIAELTKDPKLMEDHPKLSQIQAKLSAFNINKGTPRMDEVVEGTYEVNDELHNSDDEDGFDPENPFG